MKGSYQERFECRVDKSAGPDACWPWLGTRAGNYGILKVGTRRLGAHRVAWHLATGDPLDMPELVRHYECRTPLCVNPKHLRKGTPGDNSQDMVRDGKSRRGVLANTNKLSEEQVLEMRRLRATGVGPSALGRMFGVSQATASDICLRKSWAWL